MALPGVICEFRPGAGPLDVAVTAPTPVFNTSVVGVAGSTVDTPSTTPTTASDLDLRWAAGNSGGAAFGQLVGPAGYEQHSALSSNDFTVAALASRQLSSGAATGVQTFTTDPTANLNPRHGFTVTVQSSPERPARVLAVTVGTFFGPGPVTIARPAGVVAGDLLFAFHSADVGEVTEMGISGGAAWLNLVNATGGLNNFHTRVWWRVARPGEPPGYDFTQNGLADGVVTIVAVRDAQIDDLVWTDISGRLRSAQWTVGRDNEFELFPPATATLVLDNRDRHLDPEFNTGPWFGMLDPRTPFRLRTATQSLYSGFVEDGFEQDWRPPSDIECTVTLVDLLGVLQGIPLPAGAYDSEVAVDAPLAWWSMDETAGTVMGDSSGNGHDGVFDNGRLGQDALVVGEGASFEAPHRGGNRGRFQGEALPHGPPLSIEAWIRTPRDPAFRPFKTIVGVQRDFTSGFAVFFGIGDVPNSPDGEPLIWFGQQYRAHGSTRIDDGRPHHVVLTYTSTAQNDIRMWVDGAEQSKTVIDNLAGGTWPDFHAWSAGDMMQSDPFGLDGLIDEVAVYDYSLPPGRVASHHRAGSDGFTGERAGVRIQRVLDVVGVPAQLRDVAVGDTSVGAAAYGGDSAGDYLSGVVESEQGFLHVDHADGGRIRFRGRYTRFTEPRSTAIQAALTDEDLVGALHYERDGLEVDPNGIGGVVNQADVSWPGGNVRVEDVSSTAQFGPQSRSITTEAPSRHVAASAGQWLVSRYAQPQVRVRGLRLNPAADDRLVSAALGLRASDLVTVRRHPQQTGAAITNELFVEGVSHQVEGVAWRTSLRLSTADLGDVWIWGTSAWGVDAVWG